MWARSCLQTPGRTRLCKDGVCKALLSAISVCPSGNATVTQSLDLFTHLEIKLAGGHDFL